MTNRLNRIKRHSRIRAKVFGTAVRPRLSVFRSNRHIHMQLIDDSLGKTLAAATSREVKTAAGEKGTQAAKLLAERAMKLGIKAAVFDRGGFKYHGQVKKIADAVREAGLTV